MRLKLHLIALALLCLSPAAFAKDKNQAPAKTPAPSFNVGILPFQDASGSDTGGQLKEVLAKQLQAALLSDTSLTPKLMKLGGENPEETDVDIAYAVKLGKYYKSDLVVMGSLLAADVEEKDSNVSGPSFGGVNVSGQARSQDASVVLQAVLVDVARGQKLISLRAKGKQHEGKISPNVSTGYGSMNMGDANFQKTPLGKATQLALADLVKQIVNAAESFSPASGSAAAAGGEPSGSAESATATASTCHVLFRVLLSSSMTPVKEYTVAVGGADRSAQVKDGVLQIDKPAAQLGLEVKVNNPPADTELKPAYSGQVACTCDKPEKVLVLEIDSQGEGKFNWWQ